MSTQNEKRVCGPSKESTRRKLKESPAWDHEKSLRTKMRSLALMLAMIQVQQDELAFDDDVDEK
jgi:hypothetical protein